MSSLLRIAFAILTASVMAACSIHPLPEDISGVPTYTIVRKIRCEARAALKDNLVRWLKVVPDDPLTNKIGFDLESGARPLSTLNANLFTGPVAAIVKEFEDSGIAYDFTFDMTETNNLGSNFDFLGLFSHGTVSSGLGAGIDRSRENIRTFTITDTFIKLMRDVKDDYCKDFTFEQDYMYPITGRVGVDEMVHTFVELSLFANLSGKSGPPTMVDTISFTTKLSGSVSPKVVLTPVGSAFHLADASLTASASRTDAHKLIIGMSLPPPPKKDAPPPTLGLFVTTAAGGTDAEKIAAHAVEQVILRFELGKPSAAVTTNP